MTIKKLERLTGETPLSNRREEDIRRLVLAACRLTYEAGRLDALTELEELIS